MRKMIERKYFNHDKTRDKICTRYYWSGIVNQIDQLVSESDTCQRSNKIVNKIHAELHPIKVKAKRSVEQNWDRFNRAFEQNSTR